ncbi:MAG: hypothetical protein ACLFMT_02860 [Halobacteriales archaeon]
MENSHEAEVQGVPRWFYGLLGGAAYVLVVQAVVYVSGFTTEVLWLWPLGLADAWEHGSLTSFLGSPEWWLAFLYPVSVAFTGYVAAHSYVARRNPLPFGLAAVYVVAFAASELVLGLELGLLFVLVAPVVAALAFALGLESVKRRMPV